MDDWWVRRFIPKAPGDRGVNALGRTIDCVQSSSEQISSELDLVPEAALRLCASSPILNAWGVPRQIVTKSRETNKN